MQPLGTYHEQGMSPLPCQQQLLLCLRQIIQVCGLFQVLAVRPHQHLVAGDVQKRLPVLLDTLAQEIHNAVGNDS